MIGAILNWDFKKNGTLKIRDRNGNLIYFESKFDEITYWAKWEKDINGNDIYFEDSKGATSGKKINKIIEINTIKYKLIKL